MQRENNGDVCYRKEDVNAEQISCSFLNDNFYRNLKNIDYECVTDWKRQRRGIDIVLKFQSGQKRYVDNKSANLQWMNSSLDNAAIELSFRVHEKDEYGYNMYDDNKSPIMKRVDGWFLNPDYATHYYLFYWTSLFEENGFPRFSHHKKTNYFKYFKKNDIESEEIMLVEKRILKMWCDYVGLTEERLRYYVSDILKKPATGSSSIWNRNITDAQGRSIKGVVGITRNVLYKERPVLLILNHDIMTELAFLHCIVTPDKIKDLECPRRSKSKRAFLLHD